MVTRAGRRTSARWSSDGRCLCTVRARSRISHNEFPFGPNKKFLANAGSWVQRLVERWQFGAIEGLDIANGTKVHN